MTTPARYPFLTGGGEAAEIIATVRLGCDAAWSDRELASEP